ncbi:MAG: hypothetical protein RQ761_07820 [Bacteroidales bacterium]|nr:hypothetical protein [Bacteroidales bacterium]
MENEYPPSHAQGQITNRRTDETHYWASGCWLSIQTDHIYCASAKNIIFSYFNIFNKKKLPGPAGSSMTEHRRQIN